MSTHHTENRLAYEDSHVVPTLDNQMCGDSAVRVQSVLQNFPEAAKTADDATEMIEFFEDLLGVDQLRRMAIGGANGQVFQADPLKVKLLDIITLMLELVKGYPCEQDCRGMCWSFDDPIVDDINGHWTPAEGARRLDVKKFTMYKRVAVYADRLRLPPRKDQRSTESRKLMSEKLKEKYQENR